MFLLNLIHFVQKKIFHISIHPMFLLNLCQIDRRNAYCHYFNTSHVSIKPFYYFKYISFPHISIHPMFLLNSSVFIRKRLPISISIHPMFLLNVCLKSFKLPFVDFNTSHVSIKRRSKSLPSS